MDKPPESAVRAGHQREALDSRRIVRWAAAIAVALVSITVAAWGILLLAGRGLPEVASGASRPQPDPETSASTLRAFHDAQQAPLHSYGWIDREHGVVRIPVERAVELLLARGARTHAPSTGPAAVPSTGANPAPPGGANVAPSTGVNVVPSTAATVAPSTSAAVDAGAIAHRVGFEERPGMQLPLDPAFDDDAGAAVRLGDYFGRVPVLVVFTYFGCAALCPTVIGALADQLGRSGLDIERDYRVVVVSIDPGDTPALAVAKRASFARERASAAALHGWHLLTGDEAAITQVTDAAGFRYAYDSASQQFAHPAGFLVALRDGRIARYFAGFDFTPADLRAAVQDAAAARIASPFERALMLCFHFEPAGRYSAAILEALRALVIAGFVAGIAGLCLLRLRAAARRRAGPG